MARSATQTVEVPGAVAAAQPVEVQASANVQPPETFEPVTPRALEKLAASATAGMTVAQVMRAIDDGQLVEPITSYLCADGHYARRG